MAKNNTYKTSYLVPWTVHYDSTHTRIGKIRLKLHIGDVVRLTDPYYLVWPDDEPEKNDLFHALGVRDPKKCTYIRRGSQKDTKWRVVNMVAWYDTNFPPYAPDVCCIYCLCRNVYGDEIIVRYHGLSKYTKINAIDYWPKLQEIRDNFNLPILIRKRNWQ